jgi:DNA-binding IclR family transcriptional regulator
VRARRGQEAASPAGDSAQGPIQSIERAAQLLGLFTEGRAELDLNEITRLLGFTRTTAHRYCMALRRVGLLRYEPSTGVYGLGARAIELGIAALDNLPIVKLAAPFMDDLVRSIDRTVVMSVWDGQAPVIVRVNDNTSDLVRISVRVGSRLPLFQSAQGLIFLALSPRVRQQYDGHPRLGDLADDLAFAERRQVSIRSEIAAAIRAIGTPVFHGREVAATLAIVGTIATVPDDVTSPMVEELLGTAAALSRELEVIA